MVHSIIMTIIYLSINNHNVLVNKPYYKKHFNINNSMSSKRGNAQTSTNQVTQLLNMHRIVLTNQAIEQQICNIN